MHEPGTSLPDIEMGSTYVFLESRPVNSLKVFFNSVSREMAGLCITRTNPNILKKSYPVLHSNAKAIWLTDVDSTIDTADPSEPERLRLIITDFISDCLKKNIESIILLDGFEHLIRCNGFKTALMFIIHIKDFVSMYNTAMVVPVNRHILEEQELHQLEREFDIVRLG